MKRLMMLLGVLLLFLPAQAMAEEKGEIYTIKKGDTLWGISERFIKDPNYWPSLWSNNPFIRNPHFIYPGQKVRIYDGRIEIVPEYVAVEPVAEAPVPQPPVEPKETITLRAATAFDGFISLEDYQAAGQIIDAIDNRIMVAEGDTVFAELRYPDLVSVGDVFSIFTEGRQVLHPVTGDLLGYQVEERGTLRIERKHEKVVSGMITDSIREIERGAKLIPLTQKDREVVLKKADRTAVGYIVAARDLADTLSVNDVIYVDLGAEQGLEVGNLLNLSRPRLATELAVQDEEAVLPELLLGVAVVVDVRPQTAAALVIKQVEPIYRGDRVTTVTE